MAAAAPSLSVEDDTVYVPAPWGSNPVVMEPIEKVRAWAAAARTSTAVVQTTVSFVHPARSAPHPPRK